MRSRAEAGLAGRILGAIYLFGAAAGASTLVLPNSIEGSRAMWLMLGIASATGALVLLAPRRIPPWAYMALTLAGTGLICTAILAGGSGYAAYSLPFVWMTLFSAYFFTERFLAIQLAWILGSFGVTLALVEPGDVSSVTLWLLTAVVLSVTAAVIASVVRHRTRAQAELRRFFDLSLDMLCTMRTDSTVVEANRAWEETLGIRPEDLQGRPLMEHVHPEDVERTESAANEALAGSEVVDFENRYRDGQGEWRWLSWRATLDHDTDLIHARAADVTERKARMEEISRQASHDFLTGLPNRRQLSEVLGREIARARRHGSRLSVGVLDLDHFKAFNDAHGHLGGDALLEEAAAAWSAALREGDFLSRTGGEEFVVVMPDCDVDEAAEALERLRGQTPRLVTCSAGVASWLADEDIESLLSRADQALYESKEGGRDRISLIPA